MYKVVAEHVIPHVHRVLVVPEDALVVLEAVLLVVLGVLGVLDVEVVARVQERVQMDLGVGIIWWG